MMQGKENFLCTFHLCVFSFSLMTQYSIQLTRRHVESYVDCFDKILLDYLLSLTVIPLIATGSILNMLTLLDDDDGRSLKE